MEHLVFDVRTADVSIVIIVVFTFRAMRILKTRTGGITSSCVRKKWFTYAQNLVSTTLYICLNAM